jgi:hypothetical protein
MPAMTTNGNNNDIDLCEHIPLYALPNLTCDVCSVKMKYGDTKCYSDIGADVDVCQTCHDGASLQLEVLKERANLELTTTKERIAPMASDLLAKYERANEMASERLMELYRRRATEERENITTVFGDDDDSGMPFVAEFFGPPNPELLAAMMAYHR